MQGAEFKSLLSSSIYLFDTKSNSGKPTEEEYVIAQEYVLLSDNTKAYGDDVFHKGTTRIYTGGPWNAVQWNMFNSCDNAKAYRDGLDGYPQNAKAVIRELTIASELGSDAATDYLRNEEDNLKKNLSDCTVTAEKKWNEATQLGRQIARGIVQRYEAKSQSDFYGPVLLHTSGGKVFEDDSDLT